MLVFVGIVLALVLNHLGMTNEVQSIGVIAGFNIASLLISMLNSMTKTTGSYEDAVIILNRDDPRCDLLSLYWVPDIDNLKEGDLVTFRVHIHHKEEAPNAGKED